MENAHAQYAIQSHWLTTECKNTPDLIVGTTDILSTIPFSGLVITGPGYCGDMWIADCSHPGICMSSLDLTLSFGYKSFQDSYFSFLPQFDQWVFPIDTKGSYCKIDSGNQTALLLENSHICWNGFSCGYAEISQYQFANCTGNSNIFTSQQTVSNYSLAFVSLTSGTEAIVWTTFISNLYSVIQKPEPMWVLSLSVILLSTAIIAIHLFYSAYKYYRTKRWNFIAFVIGYILAVIEFITVYLSFTEGAISGIYPNLFYSLSSGFTMALNGVCLMEIVFKSKLNRIAAGLLIFVLYFCFGLPYIIYAIIHRAPKTPFVSFMKKYFDDISYPVWQIVCAIADPLTAAIIIGYIIKACLIKHSTDHSAILQLVLTDYKLVAIFLVSLINFLYITFLQLATTYTMYAQNDKIMTMYQTVFSLQHAISACCTLWYYLHFPAVLEAGKKLRKQLANRKPSQKDTKAGKSNKTVQSAKIVEQDSLITAKNDYVTAKNL
ncbi:hypothetical protein HDV06_001701 [Boothiomyces sp. JEL0866]|nr:hypothetical protein HDV06_001701 [Boothiomyces sp. JEL0866]